MVKWCQNSRRQCDWSTRLDGNDLSVVRTILPTSVRPGSLAGMSSVAPVLQEESVWPQTVDSSIWRLHRRSEIRMPYHFHSRLEYLVVLRGWTEELVGVDVRRAHAGQLLWHLPGVPHVNLGHSADVDLRVVYVEPEMVPDLAALTQAVVETPVVESSSRSFAAIADEVEAPCDAGQTWLDRTPQVVRATRLAVHATLDELRRSKSTSLSKLAHCLLYEHPEWSRRDLCLALDISPAHLSRSLRQLQGRPLQEHRTLIRLVHFVTSVTRRRQTWLQAAHHAGFGSYSQLFRSFAAVVGMSPSDYFLAGGQRHLLGVRRN